jgi:hypothetical protein
MLAERAQRVRIGHRRLLILRITVVALAPILGEAIERALILWQLGALGEAARHLADAVASGEGERARKHGGAGYERRKMRGSVPGVTGYVRGFAMRALSNKALTLTRG